jgi:hypothetical protein
MRELNPDGDEDADEDADEVTEGWDISYADDHAGQFRSGHPDTAAGRKSIVIGRLTGGAKHHHHRRTAGGP